MPRFLVKDTAKHIGEKVRVCGWVNTRRAHGKILFIDLRDISGILQVVFVPSNKEAYDLAQNLRPEWVVEIVGQIVKRPEQMVNPKIETGQVELSVESLKVLSEAETPPIPRPRAYRGVDHWRLHRLGRRPDRPEQNPADADRRAD